MNYKTLPLGEMVKISKGKKYTDAPIDNQKYRYINIEDLHGGNTFRYTNDEGVFAKKNDVLIAWDGANAGKVGVGFEGVIGSTLAKLQLKLTNVSPVYLFWYLESKSDLIRSQRTGATIPHVNGTALREMSIPLVDIGLQKKIAHILDKADALRKKDQQLLKYYDDLAQALFIEMFGDPVKNEKKWPIKKLREVCVKITDGTHFSPPNQNEGIPYITAKHLKKNFIDFYSNPTFISYEDHKAIYSRCTPEKGDVLYIKDGATTGIAAINQYDFEFSMLSSLALIKVNKQVLKSSFLAYWLNNENVKDNYIRTYMAGAAIRRFTLDKINKFEIQIPPISLQDQFAAQIQNIEQQKEKVKAQIQASEELFQALLQQAFSGGLN